MREITEFNSILNSFRIKALCVNYSSNENYCCYDVKLQPRSKVKDLNKYLDEISLALNYSEKPSLKVFHDQGIVRIGFFLSERKKIDLFDLFSNDDIPKGNLQCLLGKAVDGSKIWMDLANNPHMIVAGTTGSGKSTLLHNIIANLLNYSSAKLFLLDPKNIEFFEYENKHNVNINIGYSYDNAVSMINTLLQIMDSRYDMMRQGHDISILPNCVLIVDEFADLIMQDIDGMFYTSLCRLAQKCRVAKINIILSTQRPSADIISGAIKANFPARISCKVSSNIDSRVILDHPGAESLCGYGDALIKDSSRTLERFQIAYTNSKEVCKYLL